MENKQMLEEFLELVQIPVNSRNERQIADVLKAKLEALGLEVTEEDTGAKIGGNAGNIRAVLRGTADCEPLLFPRIWTVLPITVPLNRLLMRKKALCIPTAARFWLLMTLLACALYWRRSAN